ncbi:hypothetical protein Bca52824_090304 [Brassica carinata]|uniref:TFIIS N-terminal domain-containing protein n=1 Tax=Brassica carinata TaxID=52824 RepID=A0A8X7TIR6_BRACI|nr:hypothetical protein Bca52824_090304 [Brassica carinata]
MASKKVVRIKDILLDKDIEPHSVILDSLRKQKLMSLNVDILKSTEIGKAVNGLTKHGSDKDELEIKSFWILKKLLSRGYSVHAAIRRNGESEIEETIREMEATEERLVVYDVDVLDYQSILVSLKTCNAVFCCLDSPEGYDEKEVDLEVRGAINVVEACGRTESIEKIVFSSSLTASIWRDNIGTQKDVDEKCWSDQDFCRNKKLWHALAKMLSEKAAWALAMDRRLNMVSINPGLIVGPSVAQHNPRPTMSYLKGAAQMYENGVLAYVDVKFLADVHVRAFEDVSACPQRC